MLFGWFSSSTVADFSTSNLAFQAMQHAANTQNHQQQQVLQGNNFQVLLAQPDVLSAAGDQLFAVHQRDDEVVVAYGRIDDAYELAEQLSIPVDSSDAQILLTAYLQRGDAIKQQLSGDWLVLHLTTTDCVVLQCHQGYSSCYYQQQGDVLMFASRLPVLLAAATKPLTPEWHQIANLMLAWHQGSMNEQAHLTKYEHIYRVPCGQQLRFNQQGITRHRYYWPLEEICPTPPTTPAEAVAQLEMLLEKSVRSRLNKRGRVASMLSGGFDSSTVTVYAAALKSATQPTLPTYSHVPAYPEFAVHNASVVGNEKPLIDDVIAMTPDLEPHFIDSADKSVFTAMQQTLKILGQPIHAGLNTYWLLDIFERSVQDGNAVLLSGEMGNATTSFAGSMYELPFRTFLRRHGVLRAIKHKWLTPWLLNPWRRLKKRLGIYPAHFFSFGYMQPSFCATLGLREKIKTLDFLQGSKIAITSSRHILYMMQFAGAHPRGQMGAEFAEYFGFLFSDPFSYRPLAQYMFCIPSEFFVDDHGRPKALIRQLMRHRLPASILNARAKGRQSGDICRRIDGDLPAMAALLEQASSSPHVQYALDLTKLTADFNKLRAQPIEKRSVLLCHSVSRAMMLIMFLQQFDEQHQTN